MTKVNNKFAKIIKELREEKGLSQEKLAAALSKKRYYISNLEQGRTEPDLDMLIVFAAYFEVSVDCLLGLED